jgi:hypothetical protein
VNFLDLLGFQEPLRLDLSLLRIVVPAAAGRNPEYRCSQVRAVAGVRRRRLTPHGDPEVCVST